MTSKEILQASLLDLLFENRNKQYGAYALRKEYNKRVGAALVLGISTVFISLLLLVKDPSPQLADDGAAPGDYHLIDIVLPPEIKLPPPPRAMKPPPAQMAAEKFTSRIEVVKTTRDVVPATSDLLNKQIGSATITGLTGPSILPPLPSPGQGTGAGTTPPATEPEKKPEIMQRAAQFPGGMEAWLDYLARHLRHPDDLGPGEKKTVLIQFQVAVDGSVTGFVIVQSAGKYFDNEVIRVLKKMPKWVPAVQNGTIVPVSFNQPVTFVGPEE